MIVLSLASDLRPDSTVEHPYAVEMIPAGSPIDVEDIEWKLVPAGVFDPVALPATATRTISQGEPILAQSLGNNGSVFPEEWWIVSLDSPEVLSPGTNVRVVVAPISGSGVPQVVAGVTVGTAGTDPYGMTPVRVAVPSEAAPGLAVANRDGRTMLLVVPGD